MLGLTRRQRIDKYLDTRRLIATAADHVATDRSGKSQAQDVGLPESLIAFAVIGSAEAGRWRSPTTWCLLLCRKPTFLYSQPAAIKR